MRQDLVVSKSVLINADISKVWNALTNPAIIKQYLYGTNTVTDWKVGSDIIFEGEYQDQEYRDHGKILEFIPEQKLSYTYWTNFSGLDDKPENYSVVTCSVSKNENNTTTLTWSMQGFATEEGYKHSESGMGEFLQQIKAIVEK